MPTASRDRTGTIMALDVGERRIGVAVANTYTRLPRALTTLQHTADIITQLQALLREHQAVCLVVGLPRGLNGQHTAQTAAVEQFAAQLTGQIHLPVQWQDEALTSQQAEAELRARGKPYAKGDIDALSAVYILEDFLRDHSKESLQ